MQQIEFSSTGYLYNIRVLYTVYMIALQLFFMDVIFAQFHKKAEETQYLGKSGSYANIFYFIFILFRYM